MNFYALNVAPINGWETHLGMGGASLVVTAQGTGRTVMHPAGTAAMAQSAAGNLRKAVAGTGTAMQALAATGSAYTRMYGIGLAGTELLATGDGIVLPFFGGVARMALTASGKGAVSPLNAAMAAIKLQAADVSINAIAVRGTGTLEIALNAKYGIPASHPRAGTIKNKRDRAMLVATDSRKFSVLADVEMRLRKREPLRVARDRRS